MDLGETAKKGRGRKALFKPVTIDRFADYSRNSGEISLKEPQKSLKNAGEIDAASWYMLPEDGDRSYSYSDECMIMRHNVQ